MSRRTKPPIGDIRTPEGASGEREIEFLRLVRMVGIFGLRPEQEHPQATFSLMNPPRWPTHSL